MRVSTALVVSGGGLQGAALIKSLRALGNVRVLVADCHRENVGRFDADAYFQAPMLADTEGFAAFLQRLCLAEGVGHLLPTTDIELGVFSALQPALHASGTRVWVSSAEALALARNKLHLAEWLRKVGLPVLPTFATVQEVGVAGPLIGKPLAGYGGRGIVQVASRDEALALPADQREGLAWQPCLLSFEEYSIDFAIAGPGQVSPAYLRRRLRTSGGFAVLCEPSADPLVSAIAERSIQALSDIGALGVLNLQVLVAQGQGWVSDFNARAGMSLPLTLAAGGNPMALLLGTPCPPQVTGEAVRTVRTLSERLMQRPDLTNVRGVVFDLDDTLFDHKDWIVRKLRLVWQSEQGWLPPEPGFMRAMLAILEEGERARLFDVYAQQQGLPEASRLRLIEAFRAAQPSGCRLYPDVLGTLTQLRRLGFKLGLLTDNPAASQRAKIQCAGLDGAFDALVLTGDLGCRKPERLAFDTAAERLSLAPEQLVMVGDHLFRDTLGALEAGYAHAFHLQRAGGFFNFDLALCRPLLPAGRWSLLDALHELNWYLSKEEAP